MTDKIELLPGAQVDAPTLLSQVHEKRDRIANVMLVVEYADEDGQLVSGVAWNAMDAERLVWLSRLLNRRAEDVAYGSMDREDGWK